MSDFDALERAIERDARKADKSLAKPVVVKSLADLQRVVADFAPATSVDGKDTEVSTVMSGENEEGVVETYRVAAVTKTRSRRTMILEGMEVIKRYREVVETSKEQSIPVEINGVSMLPPALKMQNPRAFVDPLIKRWMGAYRDGLRICWDLSDGFTYYYDIYEHKLTRARREA